MNLFYIKATQQTNVTMSQRSRVKFYQILFEEKGEKKVLDAPPINMQNTQSYGSPERSNNFRFHFFVYKQSVCL